MLVVRPRPVMIKARILNCMIATGMYSNKTRAITNVIRFEPNVQAFRYEIRRSLCFWSNVIDTIMDIVEICTAAQPTLKSAGSVR